MLHFLKRLFHRPAIRQGSLYRGPRSSRQLRNERFASYLSSYNRRSVNTDWQDTILSLRRIARHATMIAGLGLLVWIVVESAQAVGIF